MVLSARRVARSCYCAHAVFDCVPSSIPQMQMSRRPVSQEARCKERSIFGSFKVDVQRFDGVATPERWMSLHDDIAMLSSNQLSRVLVLVQEVGTPTIFVNKIGKEEEVRRFGSSRMSPGSTRNYGRLFTCSAHHLRRGGVDGTPHPCAMHAAA